MNGNTASLNCKNRSQGEVEYEYGILHSSYPDEPYRDQMTEEEARTWIRTMGFRPGMFKVIRRPIVVWEVVE